MAYGLGVEDVYDYLYQKYFNLQPYLSNEIEDFYLKNMKNKHPILGMHIRGSDKIKECPNLYQLNNLYPKEIDSYLKNNPDASIFLLTDSESILTRYKELYGNKLIYTDSKRTSYNHVSVHNGGVPYYDTKQKCIDIIKDTYLAMKCNYFIGNHSSNVSVAVSRLKIWPEETIKLL
ncbi:O-fucosyltransferase family protein [Bacillus sp. FJAT-53711]|uniref:O-fucosyltransferase family protein n=1 Tax=Bacillus yunxiaonensis TaxID=3127665 RepID=A0ABU8FSM1_9BACI